MKYLATPGLTPSKASGAILAALQIKLADIFSARVDDMDAALPLSHFGVDSLVAVGAAELGRFRPQVEGDYLRDSAERFGIPIFGASSSLIELQFLDAVREKDE